MKLNLGKLLTSALKIVGPIVVALVSAKAQGAVEKAAARVTKKIGKG